MNYLIVMNYDTTLRSLLDSHAPAKTVTVRMARTARWYDAECRKTKKLTRRLEKQYRKTKSSAARMVWRSQSDVQRQLFQQKLRDYWLKTINSCKGDPRALWSKLRDLMSPPSQCHTNYFTPEQFSAHFSSIVEKIRSATGSAPPPMISTRSAADW